MIKYKAVFWCLEVDAKIIEKETDKFVVYKAGFREAKESQYYMYFDTRKEAIELLLARQQQKAKSLEESLLKTNAEIIKLSNSLRDESR